MPREEFTSQIAQAVNDIDTAVATLKTAVDTNDANIDTSIQTINDIVIALKNTDVANLSTDIANLETGINWSKYTPFDDWGEDGLSSVLSTVYEIIGEGYIDAVKLRSTSTNLTARIKVTVDGVVVHNQYANGVDNYHGIMTYDHYPDVQIGGVVYGKSRHKYPIIDEVNGNNGVVLMLKPIFFNSSLKIECAQYDGYVKIWGVSGGVI